jgi:chromosome segregation ATPase
LFIISLSGDRQRDQVVRLLLDSLQNSIGQSVRGQVSRATEEISAQFRSVYDDLIKTQAQSLESTNNQCLSITTGVSTKVDKCYETINKFEQEIINTKKLYASFDGGLNNIRESCNLYESNLQHVKESIAGQQTLLEMLQGTSHQSRQVHVTELQSMREMISTLQNTVISIESGQRVLRSDNESKRKDTTDEIERIQNNVSESNRVNQRGLDSLRLEMSEGLSAITTANAHAQSKRISLDDPIYKRSEELEERFESKLNSLEKSLREQTTNYNEVNNEISLMKQNKPAPVLQQVQMKFVSNDDPLYQRCELLESKISNSDKSSRQQAQQVTSLGDELTSISTTTQLQRQTQAQAQLRITALEAHVQRPIASDDPLYKRCEYLEGKIANLEKSMREQQREVSSIVNNSPLDSTSNSNNRTLNPADTINIKKTEDDSRKIQDIAIKLNQLDQSVAKILLQNEEAQEIPPEKISTTKLDSITGIQDEITILHNAFDKVTDEQEKTKLQISQLLQRIEFLDADKSNLENQDNLVTNELSKIKLDIENINKISVTKLQAEIVDKFDTLTGSHKRIQQGVDILQEELSSVSDTVVSHGEMLVEQEKNSSIISENLLQLKDKGCCVANRCISKLNEKGLFNYVSIFLHLIIFFFSIL